MATTLSDPEPSGATEGELCTQSTEFQRFCDHYRTNDKPVIAADGHRDELLIEYRRLFDRQFLHDLDYNLLCLQRWAEHLQPRKSLSSDATVSTALARLNRLRTFLHHTDAWSTQENENHCWVAAQQYFCDALALADRLFGLQSGRFRASSSCRRYEFNNGAGAFGLLQAAVNVLEQAVPNLLEVRPTGPLLRWLFYYGSRQLVPWPGFRWSGFLQRAERFRISGGLARLAGSSGDPVELSATREFLHDDSFFDAHTHLTRHNIILAVSHRHATLDAAVIAAALRGVPHAVMVHGALYPRSARRDPLMIRVGCGEPMAAVLSRVADIVSVHALCLVIAVDGTVPYLPYGQQMRVKRGIRVIVEYLNRRATASRKTYVVPLTLDDVVSFVQGRDDRITVTCHQPICTEDIAPAPPRHRPGSVSGGDPLLNHLELGFIANSGVVRHGWRTPGVIETVQRARERRADDSGTMSLLRRRLHASIFDLSRDRDRYIRAHHKTVSPP